MDPSYLVVSGGGLPESIDPYLYGDNGRAVTLADGSRFAAVVTVVTTGGFGPQEQADRLASGMFGATVHATFEDAVAELSARAKLLSIFAPGGSL